ncbi:36590_t:CDS:2, partial [Racocetra persica]
MWVVIPSGVLPATQKKSGWIFLRVLFLRVDLTSVDLPAGGFPSGVHPVGGSFFLKHKKWVDLPAGVLPSELPSGVLSSGESSVDFPVGGFPAVDLPAGGFPSGVHP